MTRWCHIDQPETGWIVRVSLNGSRDGDAFDAFFDLPLIVER